eukprot:3644635-Amphidinium_carterae.1
MEQESDTCKLARVLIVTFNDQETLGLAGGLQICGEYCTELQNTSMEHRKFGLQPTVDLYVFDCLRVFVCALTLIRVLGSRASTAIGCL